MAGFVPITNDRINDWPVAGSQTWTKGDLLTLNTAGLVELAVVSSAALIGIAASSIAAPTAGTLHPIYDDPKLEFYADVDTAAQAVATLRGEDHDIVGSTGAMLIDSDGTTYNVVQVTRLGFDLDSSLSSGVSTKVYGRIALHTLNG